MRYLLPLFLIIAGCSSQVSHTVASNQSAMEEMRITLIDVKQAISRHQMDLQLLEEKIAKLKPSGQTTSQDLVAKVRQLEATQEKVEADLRQLANHANEINHSFAALEKQVRQQNERLSEVVKLKSTLNSISNAIGNGKIHRVASGESLDKIARKYNTSVEALKKANGLGNDTIMVGQELRLPE
jgi:LysM repeat protein